MTPDILEQNSLAALLSASINTEPLVCKSNAEERIGFTCVVTITTVSKHMWLKIILSKWELQISIITALEQEEVWGGVVREGLTDGFNNKAQLTEVVKVCEQSTSPEPDDHISLTKLLLNSLNFILFSTLVNLWRTSKELWCSKMICIYARMEKVWNCLIYGNKARNINLSILTMLIMLDQRCL